MELTNTLDAECDVLTRMLIDVEATASVKAAYGRAHSLNLLTAPSRPTRFDRALVAFARWHPWAARLADAHARLFVRRGLLRRKVVLVLALLETDRGSRIGAAITVSRSRALCVACSWFIAALLRLVLGVVVFIPLRIACAGAGAIA